MSVSETAHRPETKGRGLKIWLAILAIIAVGIAFAWAGAKPLRGELTEGGVRLRTLEKGEGPLIQPMDGVLLDYEGRLPDGTVFDSSQSHGGPQGMIPSQVIPGFGEALQKMQKGGRYKIHIPSKLAYGESPPPGAPIPPNTDLDFDVHVVQIVPNAGLMQMGGAAGGEPQQQAPQPEAQPQPRQP